MTSILAAEARRLVSVMTLHVHNCLQLARCPWLKRGAGSRQLQQHAGLGPALQQLSSQLWVCVAGGSKEFLVRASYLEIYNEEIRDLLSKNPQARLELKEHPERGVYVKDLMQFVVKSVAEIGSVLQVSKTSRRLHTQHWSCGTASAAGS
jgi:hypothetical protein